MKTRLVLWLILIIFFGLTGCSFLATAVSPVNQSTPVANAPVLAPTQAAEPAFVFAAEPKAAILAAMKSMIGQPFRSLTTITGKTFKMQITGEFSPPNNMHIVSKMDDNPVSEMVVIGSQGWQKKGDEAWTVMPAETVALVSDQGGLAPNLSLLTEIITSAAQAGLENVDGVPAMLYTMTTVYDAGKPTEVTSEVKVWIDLILGLPIKQEVTSSGTQTVQLIEYDQVKPVAAPTMP